MEKHNTARQPIIVLVSLYSCDCIITFAMDYGYVPPDQTYQTLKYHEMILLQTLHGAKKENMRRIAATVPIHNILERERFTFSDRSSQETVSKIYCKLRMATSVISVQIKYFEQEA